MAVVENKSNIFPAPGEGATDPLVSKGRIKTALGQVACAADDNAGSKYLLCRVPSYANVHHDCIVYCENWGIANLKVGNFAGDTLIVDTTTAAATEQLPFTRASTAQGQRWWEALGHASDPGGWLDIYAHADADAAGAGTLDFLIAWIDN